MGLNHAIDISTGQRKTILALLGRHLPNTTAWVYGSRAKWTSHPQSDLDMVVFARLEQARRVSDLREAFEESNLPFRVDLFVWDEVPESFRKQIEADHVVFSENTNDHSAGRNWLYRPRFPSHWKRNPLHALAQWVNGLAFRNIQFSATGKPVIKIAEIKGGISGQTKFTTQAFDESVRVRAGDLLFSWSGQPETSIEAFWWRGPEGWLNQHIFRVTPINGVDATFFYYLLRYLKPNFVAIARNKQTTGLGHVTRRDLENIEAALPPLSEQRAIAHVLGTLDNKIELNRRMNEALEEMARALFKSWFVDFLPVRAKMAAKQNNPALLLPQAESGTWFVYAIECADGSLYIGQTENLRQRWLQHSSSKGGCWTKSHPPQRVAYWEKQPSCQAAVEREKWLKTGFGRKWLKKEIAARTQTGDPVRAKMEGHWRRGESLPGLPAGLYDLFPDRLVNSELGEIPEQWGVSRIGDLIEIHDSKRIPLNSRQRAERQGPYPYYGAAGIMDYVDDFLFDGVHVLIGEDGSVVDADGYPVVQYIWGQFWVNNHAHVLRGKNGICHEHLYLLLQQVNIVAFVTGAVQPKLSQRNLKAVPVVFPSRSVCVAFSDMIGPLFKNIRVNAEETKLLTAQRDALLPKLVSGKLRVDTDQEIGSTN